MAYYNPAQGQPQVQYPAPIVYYAAPQMTYQTGVSKTYGPHYAREASTGLGATHIVLACVSVAAGIMAIVYGAGLYYIGIGIWAGVFYLVAGSLAIAAGKEPKNNLITSTLVFSVFAFLCGVAQLTVASCGVIEEIYGYPYYNYWYGGAVAANSMMIGVGTLEIIFGITLMAINARAIDKGSKAQPALQVAYAPPTQPDRIYIQSQPAFQPQPTAHPETVFIQSQPAFQPQPTTHPETVFIQSQPAFQPQPTTHPETVFIQSQPAFQPQPPPYYVQSQYPSTSNPPQMMYVGVHQAPLTNIKL